MKQILQKVTSRKFLAFVAAFAFSLAHANVITASSVTVAYLFAEGFVDGKNTGSN